MKKSKTSESSNSNFSTVTTPTNPEWVTSGVQGVQNRINSLLDMDASSLVPGASGLQREAFAGAEGLSAANPGFGQAQEAVRSLIENPTLATARGLLDVDLERYQNPFQQGVIDTTLAGFDRSADRVRAQQALDMAKGQRFGGSRAAITASMTEGELAQQRAAQEAGLRSAGFDRATGLATGDLNREASVSQFNAGQANSTRLAGAGLLGDLAQAQDANQRADLGLLADLGGAQREIDRQQLGADVEMTKLITALNASQPYDLFRGQTASGNESRTATSTTRTSDPMGSISALLQGAGSVAQGLGAMGVTMSDRRAKEAVKRIGSDRKGRPMYRYRYKGDDTMRIGHMAQDVEKTDPHAIRNIGGLKAIDYGLLEM